MVLEFALEGVAKGEPALFVNFQENPTQLARAIRSLGRDYKRVSAEGLHLMYVSLVELQIDSLIVTMFRRAREQNIRRIVVVALGTFLLLRATGNGSIICTQ